MNRPSVRLLTPSGTGAIATVEVRGPGAWVAVRERFTPATLKPLPDRPAPHRVYFGTLGDGNHADEVVVAVKSPETIEVHCHGGRRVMQWISGLLGDINSNSPSSRDPWNQLERAYTIRTASILLDQCHGAFDRAIDDILKTLERDPPDAGVLLDALARYAPVGRHLTTPWRVVVAGEPNVGKSSLVNALAGYQRSVVSETAGTTRDVVTTLTAIDSWPVEILDTAGLRTATNPIEAEGVGRAETARTEADLVVWVLDGSAPATPSAGSDFVVINKTDLPPGWDGNSFPHAVRVSAETGSGIPTLLGAIAARLVPDPPPAGTGVPYTPALADEIIRARAAYLVGNFGESRTHLANCRGSRP